MGGAAASIGFSCAIMRMVMSGKAFLRVIQGLCQETRSSGTLTTNGCIVTVSAVVVFVILIRLYGKRGVG